MNEIIIAVVAVSAIGLVAGIILALAGHFFFVPTDETVEKLRAELPGANCGGCGFSGCDGYAEGIKNGAPCNLCAPGGNELVNKLSEIMGVEAVALEVKKAVVLCRGTNGAVNAKYENDGIETCRAVSLLSNGDGSCNYGCLGYGDCAKVCNENGIRVVDGVARVDVNLCIGCGACVKACPRNIIELLPLSFTAVMCKSADKGADTRKNCKNGCIGCMKCEKICHTGAIKVENFHAKVDQSKCDKCGMCAEACPVNVIFIKK